QRFFRTGPGEYGEGDVFLGVRVPQLRGLARRFRGLSLEDSLELLRSPLHEARFLAVVLLVESYRRGDAATRQRVFDAYLANTDRVNNWDLVDVSAPHVVGAHLLQGDSAVLDRLAASPSLWERRIAMLATFAFIRAGRLQEPLRIARLLLHDNHDLIHKAVGWMLRELGQRSRDAEEAFLAEHYRTMPRTALRYAIEKFPSERRRAFLEGSA
ncbi:MAG TPA: DNA alkylation repair protein, partial [Longimicrobiales bacterium]